jgi:hypothetical protein
MIPATIHELATALAERYPEAYGTSASVTVQTLRHDEAFAGPTYTVHIHRSDVEGGDGRSIYVSCCQTEDEALARAWARVEAEDWTVYPAAPVAREEAA